MSLVLDGPASPDAVPEAEEAVAPPAAARRRVPRRRLHRFLVARRAPLVKVHRWLSFLLLLWIVVESVTGSSIVFAGDIDRLWNADQFSTTAGDVGLVDATAAAREARPDDLVRYVTAPSSGDTGGMYEVWMTDPGGDYHAVLVDPGSGTVTSDDHQAPAVIALLERVHFNLNSTSVFGLAPLTVMGWMAVGWLVVLLSGFYLWYWPGVKRWARAWRVRRSRGRFTFHLDLHKAVGITVLLPLLVVVITGINFAFPNQVRDAWNVVTFGNYHAASAETPLSTPAAGAQPLTADQAVKVVSRVDPSVDVSYVYPPGGSPVGVYTVEATVDSAFLGTAGGQRDVEFNVDQYSGAVVSIEDPADQNVATRAYDDWASDVHFGTFGGLTTEVLWVLLGLGPLVLAVTGTAMWFTRRNKRRARAAADFGAAPPPDLDDPDDPSPPQPTGAPS
ncbi:PepSY-associated TM helix domain-containing protein [Aquihabitans sp. McL0605]|uniref:PepSY-associated TM helix domain-containing protein n=1 Tax=Aquihabitans sp. McL0605 TaxID=3415671 RepID=UPI003CF816CF